MAEFDTSWHASSGPQLDSAACREKLYTLAALFFGSPRIAELAEYELGCPFTLMVEEHQEPLIIRLLIETSVLIRMKDDLFVRQHGIAAQTQTNIVGTLCAPIESAPAPLNLREACNKVIHAKHINFDVFDDGKLETYGAPQHLQPRVFLYGDFRGEQWRAELDVVAWVRFGYSMFP
jgi:hypothetical protein